VGGINGGLVFPDLLHEKQKKLYCVVIVFFHYSFAFLLISKFLRVFRKHFLNYSTRLSRGNHITTISSAF